MIQKSYFNVVFPMLDPKNLTVEIQPYVFLGPFQPVAP